MEVRVAGGKVVVSGVLLTPSAARELANDLLDAAAKAQAHASRAAEGMPEGETLAAMTRRGLA